ALTGPARPPISPLHSFLSGLWLRDLWHLFRSPGRREAPPRLGSRAPGLLLRAALDWVSWSTRGHPPPTLGVPTLKKGPEVDSDSSGAGDPQREKPGSFLGVDLRWSEGWVGTGPPPSQGSPHPPSSSCLSEQGTFTQLVAESVVLTDGPLSWHSNPGLAGVFLAPGLSYDREAQELLVAEAGVYYVFLQLALQRVVAGQGSGQVSLAVHLQPLHASGAAALALTVDLPPPAPKAPNSAFGFRGCLLHLEAGQRVGVHLRTVTGTLSTWQFTQGATLLGLFRLTSEVPAGHPSPRPV
ncbi:tumor necrosis factor ligand superfamily member 9, partial [Carlito syrichta]|uniref:Tumor necrosis factor ligand superfamily member 9 n=1 Tax=Carlito syrichta TaxID=1868482 RepID=A0A1U7T025_CARSF